MSLRPGEVFAGYTVERELGSGGMGAVYLARHPRLPRHDALKLLKAELCADPAFVGRFEREAETVARLDHPNIVAVHDRGSQDGQLWISMRFIDGTNAEKALEQTPQGMPAERAVRIVARVASALDYAHRRQLLHRDVKPANILLAPAEDDEDTERVFLSDFGVAKAIGESAAHVASLTSTGSVVATLDYASPEQIKGQSLDHRSDIYALGCVLYKLLTGSVPYPGESVAARVYGHLNHPPPAPTARVPTLPPGLDAVVAAGMAKEPDDRYPTCRALAVAASGALAAGSSFASMPAPRSTLDDPYADGSPTTQLSKPVVADVPSVTADVPSVSEGWSLTALGGPWRFASGSASGRSTGAPGAAPDPAPPPPTGPRTIFPASTTGPHASAPRTTGPSSIPPWTTGPRPVPSPTTGQQTVPPSMTRASGLGSATPSAAATAPPTRPQPASMPRPPSASPGGKSAGRRGPSRAQLWLIIAAVLVVIAAAATAIVLLGR